MATTYKVKWGDTLTAIAAKYKTTVNNLVKLNNIANPDFIVVGQVLTISGTASNATTNTSSKAKITTFGLQAGTTNTIYAVWAWDRTNTDKYEIEWEYHTGDSVWFVGSQSSVTVRQSTYSPPSNALKVRFRVKPVSKTKTANNKTTYYWNASWSDRKTYSLSDNPPVAPNTPKVEIVGTKLTATLTGLNKSNGSIIQFDVAKDDVPSHKMGKVAINKTDSAAYECTIALGSTYKVRCRTIKNDEAGDWSGWSDPMTTVPSTPTIKECKTGGTEEKPELIVTWNEIPNATSYLVQYTKDKSNFSSDTPKDVSDVTVEAAKCTITEGITSGTYYVRVRAKNEKGDSEWSSVISTAVATDISAPTTWSSSLSVEVGNPVTLFWQHNAKDGSNASFSDIDLYIDGVKEVVGTLSHVKDGDTVETEQTKSYTIDTSKYDDGAVLQWRVRTAGANGAYGEWSILRVVKVNAQPELELTITDSNGDAYTEEFTLNAFPIYITASSGPDLQKAMSYHVRIAANEEYETVDNIGNKDIINEGEDVYSRYFDTLNENDPNAFSLTITAGDVNLNPFISYTLYCEVTMDSGLSIEKSIPFLTSWSEAQYLLNAQILIDKDSYTASIMPYCEGGAGFSADDILLFVYRREYDGTFTELGGDIVNGSYTFVTDPHPALDYARYRIVAMDTNTGAMSYNDLPGVLVGGKSVIIQWDEEWSSFDADRGEIEETKWSGSLLKLPYNIDVSDKNSPDVAHVAYIGRENPVSYFGTQQGASATWNVSIEKRDKETLYALRRLARWMGNVYVREPSGSGYWATVTVSFSQKHRDLVIPVTIEVTRVEGGV